MTANELMTREYPVVHPDAPVEEVIRRLKSPDSAPLPVCDGDRLVGMVGYRDVAMRALAGMRRGSPVRARDVVAPDIIYCLETTNVEEAAALMQDNDVRLLPVLNDARRVVGFLDLANVRAELVPPHDGGQFDFGDYRI